MPTSLYDLSIPNYLQTLRAVTGFLDRGLAHFQDNAIDPEAIVATRLFPDMLPFRFQIHSVVHHSLGAVEAIKSGIFGPPGARPDHDYAALQALVAEATATLASLPPAEIDARAGADVDFRVRDTSRVFTAEGFVMSMSLPNFHFHATTAYDILRANGVPIGKRDYLGAVRLKG
jgi:hypothetical protein